MKHFVLRCVAAILKSLAGLAKDVQMLPVAETPSGVGLKNGDRLSAFIEYVRKLKLKEINASVARNFVRSIGQPPASYSSLLSQAVSAGVLKAKGSRAQRSYDVRRRK